MTSDFRRPDGFRPHPRRRAFTLVEMLVVMAIMGMLMAMAVVSMGPLNDRRAVNDGAAILQAWLNTARQRAIRDKVNSGLRFLAGTTLPAQVANTAAPNAFNPAYVTRLAYLEGGTEIVGQLYGGPGAGGITTFTTLTPFPTLKNPIGTNDTMVINDGLPHQTSAAPPGGTSVGINFAWPYPISKTTPANFRIIRGPAIASNGVDSDNVLSMPRGSCVNFDPATLMMAYPNGIDLGNNGVTSSFVPPKSSVDATNGFDILFAPDGTVVMPQSNFPIVFWVSGTGAAMTHGRNPHPRCDAASRSSSRSIRGPGRSSASRSDSMSPAAARRTPRRKCYEKDHETRAADLHRSLRFGRSRRTDADGGARLDLHHGDRDAGPAHALPARRHSHGSGDQGRARRPGRLRGDRALAKILDLANDPAVRWAFIDLNGRGPGIPGSPQDAVGTQQGPSQAVLVDPLGSSPYLDSNNNITRVLSNYANNYYEYFTLTDDITFSNGAGVPRTFSSGSGPTSTTAIGRETRFTWSYLLQRPIVQNPGITNYTVCVYNRRPLIAPLETTLPSATLNISDSTISFITTDPAQVKQIFPGQWVLDATLAVSVGPSVGSTPTTSTVVPAGMKVPMANFYRIVNVRPGATANETILDLQTPIRGYDKVLNPTDTDTGAVGGKLKYPKTSTNFATLVIQDGLVEAIDVGPLR